MLNQSKFIISYIFFYFLIVLQTSFAGNQNDFIDYKLNVFLSSKNNITIKSIQDDKIIKGTLLGKIEGDSDSDFNNARLECDLLGRAYQGRSFSCGFAEVEDINGYCEMIFPDKENIILVEWKCSTTAGMLGDAVCKGKVNILKGFGEYAGVVGFGNLEMPLIKSIKKKNISIPIKLKISLKKPLQIKSQLNSSEMQ